MHFAVVTSGRQLAIWLYGWFTGNSDFGVISPLLVASDQEDVLFLGAVAKTRCTLLEYGQSKVKGRNESQTSTTEAE